ncbi:hypothetical protein ACKWTF_011135 [Chironomus riparius]
MENLEKTNEVIENTLLITLNPAKKDLYLINSDESQTFSLDMLEFSLFERVIASDNDDKVIIYLYQSYLRVLEASKSTGCNEILDKIKELIFRNISTILKQPELIPLQNLDKQFLDIFNDTEMNERCQFLSTSIKTAQQDCDDDMRKNVNEIFFKSFDTILKMIRQASMITLDKWILEYLMAFVSDKNNSEAANILLDYIALPENTEGIKYSETLLGQLLCLSITPKNNNGPYEYYDNLNSTNLQALNNLSSSLWSNLNYLHETLYALIKCILVIGGETRDKILNWIGHAITKNQKRGQIWNQHSSMVMGNFTTAPDSFMVGLSAVLLRLCLPLMKPQLKVLMVDPTYCAVKNDDTTSKQIHMKDYDKETCLIPFADENEERNAAQKYNFITEIFFMTHKCLDLSYRVCIEKVSRMNREIHRLQQAYQDAARGGGASDVTENIMNMLTKQSQILLCTQNLILEPKNDELLLQFYDASAIWLNQLASKSSIVMNDSDKGYAPLKIQEFKLPLTADSSPYLKYVPELIIENITGYLQFSKHFETSFRQFNQSKEIFLTFCLIFMGSSKRAKNPHLRANLAEALESLLPKEKNGFTIDSQLFYQHPDRLQIVENLLDVFVSIEMTGQSVQFEQKFNYRRPMYIIMQYLWNIPEQRACFKKLSLTAQQEIDNVEVPLFLRFINVLINDSIFLLDESLNNLQKIRELEEAKKRNEWDNLPQNERQQNHQNLTQLGMLARFDNILGKDTINILKLLTSETKEIFIHPSMVDRVTSMLNYFLLQLCGPNQKRFKVQNKQEFDFDPAHTVKEICSIYLNLKDREEFIVAITQDGRSYSSDLFRYAENTLIKISGGQMISDIIELAENVRKIEEKQKENDEALINPPDEFLDPILSILMREPVILPSSRVTVDKTT